MKRPRIADTLASMDPAVAERLRAAVAAQGVKVPRVSRSCPTEHEEQVALFSTIDRYIDRCPDLALIAAVPNGMRTSMRTAVKAKAEGLRSGYPDIVVDVPMSCVVIEQVPEGAKAVYRDYHGLRIEMKRQFGGCVDPEQKIWHDRLRAQGYRVEICRGCDAAWAVIQEYLQWKP